MKDSIKKTLIKIETIATADFSIANVISHVLSDIGINGSQDTLGYDYNGFIGNARPSFITASFFINWANKFNSRPKRFIPGSSIVSSLLSFRHSSHLSIILRSIVLSSICFGLLVQICWQSTTKLLKQSFNSLSAPCLDLLDSLYAFGNRPVKLWPFNRYTPLKVTATLDNSILPATPVPYSTQVPLLVAATTVREVSLSPVVSSRHKKKEPLAGKSMFAWGYKTDAKGSLISFECSTSNIPTTSVM